MEKYTSLVRMIVAMGLLMLSSGCMSYMTYQGSKEKVAMRKAVQNNNEVAIRAIKNGADPKAAGIDVGFWEAIKERAALQIGAAGGDVAIVVGGYEGIKYLGDQNSESDNPEAEKSKGSGNNSSGRDTIVVNGDGNNINTSSTSTSQVVPGL